MDVNSDLIEEVSFEKGSLKIEKGSTIDLTALGFGVDVSQGVHIPCTISAEDFVIGDTSIANIVNGQLTARNNGETTLSTEKYGHSLSIRIVVGETDRLTLGIPADVTVTDGEEQYLLFVPGETGSYTFYSEGEYDTIGRLYDAGKNQLTSDDDGGSEYNFSLSADLTAGEVYYIGVDLYNADQATFTVTVIKTEEHGASTDGFTYEILSDGTAGITGCSLTGDIVIPSVIDGYTVSNLASELFYGKSYVTSVTIPKTVTYFGTDKNDNNWDYVFSYCDDLENIYVDADNPTFRSVDGILFSKDGRTLINYPCSHEGEVCHVSADTLCCTSFARCYNLRFLFLDNPDTTWYTYTFYNTYWMTAFYKPGGRTESKARSEISAGKDAGTNPDSNFCALVSIDEISELPASLTTIKADAFMETGVKYLIIPDGCKKIEKNAFTDSSLEYVRVPSETVVSSGAFGRYAVVDRD